jgi:hypothetical protein
LRPPRSLTVVSCAAWADQTTAESRQCHCYEAGAAGFPSQLRLFSRTLRASEIKYVFVAARERTADLQCSPGKYASERIRSPLGAPGAHLEGPEVFVYWGDKGGCFMNLSLVLSLTFLSRHSQTCLKCLDPEGPLQYFHFLQEKKGKEIPKVSLYVWQSAIQSCLTKLLEIDSNGP